MIRIAWMDIKTKLSSYLIVLKYYKTPLILLNINKLKLYILIQIKYKNKLRIYVWFQDKLRKENGNKRHIIFQKITKIGSDKWTN